MAGACVPVTTASPTTPIIIVIGGLGEASTGSDSKSGTIAGAVVGFILLALLALGFLFFVWLPRKRAAAAGAVSNKRDTAIVQNALYQASPGSAGDGTFLEENPLYAGPGQLSMRSGSVSNPTYAPAGASAGSDYDTVQSPYATARAAGSSPLYEQATDQFC